MSSFNQPTTSSMGLFGAILRCELLQLLRDRRALFAAVLLPALLYPAMFWSQGKVETVARSVMEEKELTIILHLQDLDDTLEGNLRAGLTQDSHTQLEELNPSLDWTALWEPTAGPSEEIAAQESARVVQEQRELLDPAHALIAGRPVDGHSDRFEFRVFFRVRDDNSRIAEGRAGKILKGLAADWRQVRLDNLPGGDPGEAFALTSQDVATTEDKSGAELGRLLPIFALLILISGAAFAALGAFAGEREAKTLETLLVQPVPAQVIAAAKYGAVLCIGLASLAVNLFSIGACAFSGLIQMPGMAGGGEGLPFARVAAVLLYLPSCALVCALLVVFCGKARSYREGQFALIPVLFIALLPSSVVLRQSLQPDLLISMVPFAGPALLLREGLAGHVFPLATLVMLVSHGLWTWLILAHLARLLESESILAGDDLTALAGQQALCARHGRAWAFVGVLTLYLIGMRLQQWDLVWGLALSLWGLLTLLTYLALRTRPAHVRAIPARAYLSFKRPALTHSLGALLLLPGLAKLMLEVYLPFQSEILPIPEIMFETEQLTATLRSLSTPVFMLLMAVSPAVCEELFFRGLVLGSLRRGLSPTRAVLWQAFFFGAAHASLYRIIPTASLGLILGLITLRTRSLVPAILLHAGYNALVMGTLDDRYQLILSPMNPYAYGLGALGCVLLVWPKGTKEKNAG